MEIMKNLKTDKIYLSNLNDTGFPHLCQEYAQINSAVSLLITVVVGEEE